MSPYRSSVAVLVIVVLSACGRSEYLGATLSNDGDAGLETTDDGGDGADDGGDGATQLPPHPDFPRDCTAFPAPTGTVVNVVPEQTSTLNAMIAAAAPGTTFRLAPGNYVFDQSLSIGVDGTVVRSATGNPDDVVLSGPTTVVAIHVLAKQVTLAELTLTNAMDDLLHADAAPGVDQSQLLLYRVHFTDAWDTAIVLGGNLGGVVNSPVLACSTVEVTDAFRSSTWTQPQGARIFGTRNFLIYRNVFRGIYHPGQDDSLAINMSRGARGARLERNVFENSAVPLRIGVVTTDPGDAVAYTDNPCADLGAYSDVYEIAVCSNTVFADIAEFDTGIAPSAACNSMLAHNTVYGAPLAASIDVRGASSRIQILDNAVSQAIVETGAGVPAQLIGNVEGLPSTAFVDPTTRDLHLAAGSAAIGQGVPLTLGLCDLDLDGDPYDAQKPDAGADQRVPAP